MIRSSSVLCCFRIQRWDECESPLAHITSAYILGPSSNQLTSWWHLEFRRAGRILIIFLLFFFSFLFFFILPFSSPNVLVNFSSSTICLYLHSNTLNLPFVYSLRFIPTFPELFFSARASVCFLEIKISGHSLLLFSIFHKRFAKTFFVFCFSLHYFAFLLTPSLVYLQLIFHISMEVVLFIPAKFMHLMSAFFNFR